MHLTIVTGADGAPFVHDLAAHLAPDDELTVVVPVVRDSWSTGLKVSPDLDALLTPHEQHDSHAVADELVALGYSPTWQRPSDAEVAGQLIRTELLTAGYSLTEATAATAARRGLPFVLLPASDDRAELHVVVDGPDGPRAVHVAEVLADPGAHEVIDIVLVAEAWSVSDAVRAALRSADVVVLGPADRTLAIDPVLRTPGFLDALDTAVPVLVVDHVDAAPEPLVRAAGLPEPDPRGAERCAADTSVLLERARLVGGTV